MHGTGETNGRLQDVACETTRGTPCNTSPSGVLLRDFNVDVNCPHCGDRETTVHMYMCSNKDRVQVFIDRVDELEEWVEKKNKTNQAISY